MKMSTTLLLGPFCDKINGTVIFLEAGAPSVDIEVMPGSRFSREFHGAELSHCVLLSFAEYPASAGAGSIGDPVKPFVGPFLLKLRVYRRAQSERGLCRYLSAESSQSATSRFGGALAKPVRSELS
jgi:hypothetical protein